MKPGNDFGRASPRLFAAGGSRRDALEPGAVPLEKTGPLLLAVVCLQSSINW
jgi:hypothetical protein